MKGEQILKWLFDIKNAIREIEHSLENTPKDFNYYKSDVVLKRASERNLEIIGEAVNRILKKKPNIEISSAHRIVGLRNQIIHSYDNISDENIWAVLNKHIPF